MGPGDVYRAPTLKAPPPVPRPELVYAPQDGARPESAAIAAIQIVSVAAMIGTFLSAVTGPAVGIAGASVGGLLTVLHRRRAASRHGAVLEMREGELHVWSRDRRHERARARLREVVDVILDVKTFRRVHEGGSPVPAVRFTEGTIGPELEAARIVLVLEDGASLELTEPYFPHLDATEWLGKIRVFLRAHGWLPEDERPE